MPIGYTNDQIAIGSECSAVIEIRGALRINGYVVSRLGREQMGIDFSWNAASHVMKRYTGVIGGLLFLLATASADAGDQVPSGRIEISQVQVAFIGSGNLGGGTLHYQGKSYSFTVGGLGIGGFGISKMEAVGKVYDLKRLADFPGAYIQGRYGYAAGEASAGELWLKNANGVVLQLKAKREGLALSLGGDAVYINLD